MVKILKMNIQRIYNHSNASLKSADKHYYTKIYVYKLDYTHHSYNSVHPRPVLYNQDHILNGQNNGYTNIQRIYNHSNASLKRAEKHFYARIYIYKLDNRHHLLHSEHSKPVLYNQDLILKGQNIG